MNSFLKGEFVGQDSLIGKSVSAVILYQINVCDTITASEYEVVFAIAKDELVEGERPEIPFFSKVSFRSISSKLKHYGFKVSIKGIKRTYQEENNNNDGGNEQ